MTLIEKILVKNLMKSELESSKSLSKDVQSLYALTSNGNVCFASITPVFDFSLNEKRIWVTLRPVFFCS